ncbi:MAG: hypothetical protein WCG26_01405 [Chloroflexales bacterium]
MNELPSGCAALVEAGDVILRMGLGGNASCEREQLRPTGEQLATAFYVQLERDESSAFCEIQDCSRQNSAVRANGIIGPCADKVGKA